MSIKEVILNTNEIYDELRIAKMNFGDYTMADLRNLAKSHDRLLEAAKRYVWHTDREDYGAMQDAYEALEQAVAEAEGETTEHASTRG